MAFTRRSFVGGTGAFLGATALGIQPANAFWWALFMRGALGFTARGIARGALTRGTAGLSSRAMARRTAARAALRRKGFRGSEHNEIDAGDYRYQRGGWRNFMSNRAGDLADSAIESFVSSGWDVIGAGNRSNSGYVYFPNDGCSESDIPNMSSGDALGLLYFPEFLPQSNRFNHHHLASICHPLQLIQEARYDEQWNSVTPVIYQSACLAIKLATFGVGTGDAKVSISTTPLGQVPKTDWSFWSTEVPLPEPTH
jgi:hypothetical protein